MMWTNCTLCPWINDRQDKDWNHHPKTGSSMHWLEKNNISYETWLFSNRIIKYKLIIKLVEKACNIDQEIIEHIYIW